MAEPRTMVTLEEARTVVDAALAGPTVEAETLPVRAARGRILAEDQASRLELPPFDKSAMDGYALLAGDERSEYRLLETVAAGQTPTATLQPGTTVKVMTGAPVPAGTGRVIMREFTEETNGVVRVLSRGDRDNICKQGEDVRVGDVVLPAGRRIDAIDAANLIACGITHVPVASPPAAAVLVTGNEIVDDPAELTAGRIMNSNGPMLSGLAAAGGLAVGLERIVPDDPERTAAVLREAIDAAEIVVLTGGVSVGDFDYVVGAMVDVGLRVHFTSVAIKPGRPTVFATAGRTAVFGLPGNPVSVCLMFHLFVLRGAAVLRGLDPAARELRLPLASGFRRDKAKRMGFIPARLSDGGALEPLEYHGSAHLSALTRADGFFAVPVGVTEVAAGQLVTFVPMLKGLR